MWKLIVRILAVIGAINVLFFLLMMLIVYAVQSSKGSVPSTAVLEVNLETGLVEDIPNDAVAKAMLGKTPTVRDVVDAIERGAADSRVKGMIARFGGSSLGMAQAQELREAVRRFRAHKKFAVAWAETFGEFGPGGSSYYLATAFDEIWMQPSGDVGLTGIILESPFVRGTLDKLGIVPRMDHRYEYKNAMNMYTEKKFTPPHREAMEKLMTSWWSQMVQGIAEGRRLTADQVRAVVNRGPLLGQEAVDARLVDGLAYRDEVYTKVKERAGRNASLIYLQKYLERAGRPHESGKTIALIFGAGEVVRGKSGFDPIFGSASMGSATVTAAFRSAIDDPKVRAIIFRIDSPGGSYVASDAVWRETVRARKAGKPVIATMGDVAGSGGYFVAMAADKIVAQPGTVTGSIGVLGGKMLTTGFWDKLGITFDQVHEGANATYWTGTSDYTPAEWARFQAWLDRVYTDFTGKVAYSRKLPKERVLEIAKGRIWSGADAKELGLVDELGGFPTALRLAKQAARIPDSEEVNIQVFPKKKSKWQALSDLISSETPESSDQDTGAAALVRVLRIVQPVARQLRAVTGRAGVLEMQPVEGRP
jgi:protease-4